MQSHSRSHVRPAFNHLTAADGELSASLGSDDLPSAEQLRLWSFQQPSLTSPSEAMPSPSANRSRCPAERRSLSIHRTSCFASHSPGFSWQILLICTASIRRLGTAPMRGHWPTLSSVMPPHRGSGISRVERTLASTSCLPWPS